MRHDEPSKYMRRIGSVRARSPKTAKNPPLISASVSFLYVKASADAPGHSRCRIPRLSGLDEVGRGALKLTTHFIPVAG